MTLTRNIIHHLDCVTGMRRYIPDESIDLIVADPPYNLNRGKQANYSFDHSKDAGYSKESPEYTKAVTASDQTWDSFTFDEYIDFTATWLQEVQRVLKPTGSMWIFGTYHNIGVINVVLHQLNYNFINEVIWYKRNATPNLTCRNLTASHETLLWTSINKSDYFFNYDLAKTGSFKEDSYKNEGKQMRTVWDIPQSKTKEELAYGKHPTQKPLSILKRMIQISAKPNMVMMTPFAGSGSECIAAKLLGLDYVGFEINAEYIALAETRLEHTQANSAIIPEEKI